MNLIRTSLFAAVLAVSSLFGFAANDAFAGGCHSPCYYKTIVVNVPCRVTYQKKITLYDHCGKPYCVYVTAYKTVYKQVAKRVKVCR